MAGILQMVSLVSFIASGVLFILAIVLFVVFKIPSVIGDLSGRTARKSIEQMRQHNERTGDKSYSPSKVNAERGKLTETMKGEKRIGEKLKGEKIKGERLKGRKVRGAISSNGETGILRENYKDSYEEIETGILGGTTEMLVDENATDSLEETARGRRGGNHGGVPLKMLDDIMLVHTEEEI